MTRRRRLSAAADSSMGNAMNRISEVSTEIARKIRTDRRNGADGEPRKIVVALNAIGTVYAPFSTSKKAIAELETRNWIIGYYARDVSADRIAKDISSRVLAARGVR